MNPGKSCQSDQKDSHVRAGIEDSQVRELSIANGLFCYIHLKGWLSAQTEQHTDGNTSVRVVLLLIIVYDSVITNLIPHFQSSISSLHYFFSTCNFKPILMKDSKARRTLNPCFPTEKANDFSSNKLCFGAAI